MNSRHLLLLLGGACLLGAACARHPSPSPSFSTSAPVHASPQWWKGNLHTHSFWSDGDDFPEMIVDWYKKEGYHFLAISDHNTLQVGERWLHVSNRTHHRALEKYQARFPDGWIQKRENAGRVEVRLKTFEEFRPLFEEPDRFLLVQSEEITDRYKNLPVHLNATHLRKHIPPQGGNSVYEVMQNNVNAVLRQREETGQPMIPHLNHPNFQWAIMAEDLSRVQGERFFEVYNGHPQVHNEGDDLRPSTDRLWDIVLTKRLAELGLEPMYGIAVDDSHHYHDQGIGKSNSGRGWIMVQSRQLSAEALIAAMEAGDFYASSGVRLKGVQRRGRTYRVVVDPDPGVTYRIQFIGTRRGYNPQGEPVRDAAGNVYPITHRYSPEIGAILAEVAGTEARYQLRGDEIYVRARIISSREKMNGSVPGELETAWTQPLIPQ